MPDDSIERVLSNFFPPSASPDWKKMASKEIKGKDPFQILAWHGKDELLFLPYYDAQDVAKPDVLNSLQTPASESGDFHPKGWINLPEVNAADEANANTLALQHLSSGAEGILFHVPSGEHIDLHALMLNIEWPHCFVAFHMQDEGFSSALSDFIRIQHDPASVSGALFWESIPKKNIIQFYLQSCANLKALGLVIPPSTPTVEICEALVRGVSVWENCSGGVDPLKVLRSIAFSICVDQVLLETVAKLKALRMLWSEVARAYGIDDYKAADLHIHARSLWVDDHLYAPHENMLKGTYSAISAVLGGCDSLTVKSLESPVSMRWARNVSSVLREESFIGNANDPLAGSYALDRMASDIAEKAWRMFQHQMTELS